MRKEYPHHSKEKAKMAFADPQSVTINAVAQTLPRVSTEKSTSVYRKDDRTVELSIQHSGAGKNTRHIARVNHTKIAADPLLSGVNDQVGMSAYLVVITPSSGYTVAEQKQVVDGLTAYLTASSGAKVTQLLGGES